MIGGRDQQQNELVVKKYLKEGTLFVLFLWCANYLELCHVVKRSLIGPVGRTNHICYQYSCHAHGSK